MSFFLDPRILEKMLGQKLYDAANQEAAAHAYANVPSAILACALRLIANRIEVHDTDRDAHLRATGPYRNVPPELQTPPGGAFVPMSIGYIEGTDLHASRLANEHLASCTYNASSGPEGDYCNCGLAERRKKKP